MRAQPGVGYVEDHQGAHLEPTMEDGMADSIDTRAQVVLDKIYELPFEKRESYVEDILKSAELEAQNMAAKIAPILVHAPNLRISSYGLLFATNAAAVNGISMERAGNDCAKMDGAVKHIDDLSHRHHIIASFLQADERDKWLEIARLENLSASEFKTSLEAGMVIRTQGVTRAAISKSKVVWQRKLGIKQCRVGKTQAARASYRKRAFEHHHKVDFDRDFKAEAKHSKAKK